MEALNSKGQIRLAAINYSVKHYKTGKYVKAHSICALTDVQGVISKLESNPNVKNVKLVGEIDRS